MTQEAIVNKIKKMIAIEKDKLENSYSDYEEEYHIGKIDGLKELLGDIDNTHD